MKLIVLVHSSESTRIVLAKFLRENGFEVEVFDDMERAQIDLASRLQLVGMFIVGGRGFGDAVNRFISHLLAQKVPRAKVYHTHTLAFEEPPSYDGKNCRLISEVDTDWILRETAMHFVESAS